MIIKKLYRILSKIKINFKLSLNRTIIKIPHWCNMRAAIGFNLGEIVLGGLALRGLNGKLMLVVRLERDFLHILLLYMCPISIVIICWVGLWGRISEYFNQERDLFIIKYKCQLSEIFSQQCTTPKESTYSVDTMGNKKSN